MAVKAFEAEWPQLEGQLRAMLAGKRIPESKRDDITQETGLRLFKMWDKVDPERPLWPLAVTIALNLVRDDARRRPEREVLGDVPEIATGADVERESLARLEFSRVCRAITDLSPAHRSVLLAEWGEASVEGRRGSPAVKMLRLRARRKLSAILEGAAAGGFAALFKVRRLGQLLFNLPLRDWGEHVVPAGAALLGLMMFSTLPQGIANAAAPRILGIDAIDRVNSGEAFDVPTSMALHQTGRPEGTISRAKASAKNRSANKQGSKQHEDESEWSPFEVPLPTNGAIAAGLTIEAAGMGARIGDRGSEAPVCLIGVRVSSMSCGASAGSGATGASGNVGVNSGVGPQTGVNVNTN